MLALAGSVHDQHWEDGKRLAVEGGHRIGKVEPLYAKIDDDKLNAFKDKYLPRQEEGGKTVEKPKPKEEVKTMVDYEEFSRVDLRVATIKEANDHPNADKLVILKIDVGELGERTIVAGIKAKYRKEDLVGRQIIVVANLQPAKLRGVESQGMLLAAIGDDGSPMLLQPDSKAKPGAKIR